MKFKWQLQSLFVLAYFIAPNDDNKEADIKNNKKHFFRRGEINDYHVLIDGRNFYNLIK